MTIEELKALEAGLHGNDFAEGDIQTALDALPALLAVAEAAEASRHPDLTEGGIWMQVTVNRRDWEALSTTLAALETKEPKP